MLLSEDKITEIYCLTDDFCKFYGETVKNNALEEPDGKRHRNKPNRLSYAEAITILVAFHMGGHRRLKHFYLEFVCRHWTHLFPNTVSYNRFVELEREVALLLPVFVRHVLLGKCTGISFVDSTSMRVCKNQRIHCHKVFRGITARSTTSSSTPRPPSLHAASSPRNNPSLLKLFQRTN